jgi:hypothetical protein
LRLSESDPPTTVTFAPWGCDGIPDGELSLVWVHHGRTRLEIRQWLLAHLAGPSNQGWIEALDKLDATLLHIQAAAADAEV